LNYLDFIDLSYKPEEDLICDFTLGSEGMDFRTAAGGIAAESSIGTWTELGTLKPYAEKLGAKVFEIQGNNIKISYPTELFEAGNIPNILSSVAGNVFGLKGINLRLNDIHFPETLLQSFKGPKYGIGGVRGILKVSDRPLVGTIIKPKLGLKTKDHAEVAYNAWGGGCDIVKDDENLSSQKFNPFEQRLAKTLEARDRAESETGEKKGYMINVTAETKEMMRRAEMVESSGGRYVMVDIITAGFSALQTLRNQNLKLIIHAHRAGHAAFTKSQNHGISMTVIAKIARIIGVDQLHVGTAVGKMSEGRAEVEKNVKALCQGLEGFKPVFPVASGGLHPGLVPALIEIFGKDFICQAGGGIHGHPSGTNQGATAMRQAVDAAIKGLTLKEYASEHKELAIALKTWGEI
jgi:ribulose-bisphosphate carboxylase large chain